MDFDPYQQWLGIPADRRPPTRYDLLGVFLGETDLQQIQERWHNRSAEVRAYEMAPDERVAETAHRLLEEIARAYLAIKAEVEEGERRKSAGKSPLAPGGSGDGFDETVINGPGEPVRGELLRLDDTDFDQEVLALLEAVRGEQRLVPETGPDETELSARMPGDDPSSPDYDLSAIRLTAALWRAIPEEVVRQHRIVPLAVNDGELTLAVQNAEDLKLQDILQFASGMRVKTVAMPLPQINATILRLYGPERIRCAYCKRLLELGETICPCRTKKSPPPVRQRVGPADLVRNLLWQLWEVWDAIPLGAQVTLLFWLSFFVFFLFCGGFSAFAP